MPENGNRTPEERADDDRGAYEHASRSGSMHDRLDDQKTVADNLVDLATGEFLLREIDVELPGMLALVLRRSHLSGYRFGRWFGRSWSSTLDVRLVVEDAGVTFLGESGVMLAYPHAPEDTSVEPIGSRQRWTLTRSGTAYRVRDPWCERIWHFAPEPGSGGIESRVGNYAISAITDRHRNRVRFHYDSTGIPVEVVHSGGYRVAVRTAGGRVTRLSVHDRGVAVPVREFAYTAGTLTMDSDAAGSATNFVYDDMGRIVSWTNSAGDQRINRFDGAGRVVSQRSNSGILDADFRYIRFADGTGSLTAVTDADGAVTRYGFDLDHRLRDHSDPTGGRTHIDYDTDRRPLTVIAPDGGVTRYRYTRDGDIAEITRPDGAKLTAEYDVRHRATRLIDADGAVYEQEWTEDGDLAAIVDAGGARTGYSCHRGGGIATVTGPTGTRTAFEVDPAGLPVAVTESSGAVTVVHRDGFGRPIALFDSRGGCTSYEWTATGKLARRLDPDGFGESWVYDGAGNLTAHTNRAGGVTRYTYGAFGLPATRVDADGGTTGYRWDRHRRMVSETDSIGATTHYTYDRAGRVATVTPATGVTRRYSYDRLGRAVEIVAATGEYRRFGHDRAGRIVNAVTGTGDGCTHTLTRTYTPSGHLAAEQVDDRPPVRCEYDIHQRLVRRTSPGGSITAWMYDHDGRVVGLETGGYRVDFTYDAVGRSTGWRVGELELTRLPSGTGQVDARTVTAFPGTTLNLGVSGRPAPRRLFHDEYGYRPDGYLVTHIQHVAGNEPIHRHYQLDPLGRITVEKVVDRALLDSDIVRYRFDAFDQLIEVRTPDGRYRHYTYDAYGRRTTTQHRTSDGDVLDHIDHSWDGIRPIEESTESCSVRWNYEPGTCAPITYDVDRNELGRQFFAVVTDPAGVPTALVDPQSGQVADSAGTVLWEHSVGAVPQRFTGQDRGTGPRHNPGYHNLAGIRSVGPDLATGPDHSGYVLGADSGDLRAGGPADAQTSSRSCSISFTRSAGVAAIGTTFSTVTPAAANAATRSFTNPAGPISEMSRTRSSGTTFAASSFLPARYSSWIRSASAP